MARHRTVQGFCREIAHSLDLVPRHACRPQGFIRSADQLLRCRITAKELAHPPMNCCRRLAMELLVEDRFQKRFKGRRRPIQTQCELAHAINQCAQLCISRAKMRQRFCRIEGKFPALTIMNHKKTVYRARVKAVRQSSSTEKTTVFGADASNIVWRETTGVSTR